MYTSIYANETPALLIRLTNTPEMQRLSDVGMHCGCEYSDISFYKQARHPYTRLIHSIGVGKIVWNFTKDITQAVAGMLHDIATPVFAHTIDFMNNDYLNQEATEDSTHSLIENSKQITDLLKNNGIHINDVNNYHKYPIADNDTPMLSADRLEYTLANGYIVYHMCLDQIKGIYDDLIVTKNEYGVDELCFRSVDKAKTFVDISLRNSRFYISDEDRFLMQRLSEIVQSAIDVGILLYDDLYLTESEVIHRLENSNLSDVWKEYSRISSVAASKDKLNDRYCVKVSAKKRYIDPLVLVKKGVKRISEIDVGIKTEIDDFLCLNFDEWLYNPY